MNKLFYPGQMGNGGMLPAVTPAPQSIILVQEEPRGPSQLIEIPVSTNGLTKVQIPDIQQLRSQVGQTIIIKAIRLITANIITNAPTIGGVVAPIAELQKLTLTIYCEGWEKGQLIPILTLNDMAEPTVAIPYHRSTRYFDNWKNVDWSKSFIQYANGTVSANAPYSVLLEAEYVKLDAQNQEIIGPS